VVCHLGGHGARRLVLAIASLFVGADSSPRLPTPVCDDFARRLRAWEKAPAPRVGSAEPDRPWSAEVNLIQAIVLGLVEGVTEFLPVSSTGHLTITEGLLGLDVDDDAVTAFTAVVQTGAIAAVLLFFRADLVRLIRAGAGGLVSERTRADPDFRFAWSVVLGSVPIGVVGLAAKSAIEGPLRSLWVVGVALIGWSAVMVLAERRATQRRGERALSTTDVVVVGMVQCVALVPGVSRSGATISAGLMRDVDRVTATRLSFFLAIPALVGAGALELKDAFSGGVGAGPTVVGTVVAFFVAYASIAWLLRFVAHHPITRFVPYRVALGAGVLIVLAVSVATR
jgi:undecaprenyl-diphosphatase